MLQSIRDKATGPIAWFIVALIAIPFAFWGIDSYVSAPTNPEVAEVGDTEITRVQLQRAYDQSYQRLQQLMGENFKPDAIDTSQLRRGVLDNLVQDALLTQHAADAGYRASDIQILQSLRSQPAFQVDGSFSAQRYREVLRTAGYSPAAYEQQLRQSLAIEQLQVGLTNSAFITAKDVDAALVLQKQRRQLSYLLFPFERYAAKAEVSAEDVKARYELDAHKYRTEERVKLAYVELNKAALSDAVKPEAEVLKAIYDAEVKSRFTQAERRKARHILVRVDDDIDESAAKQKIDALQARIAKGEDFSSVAKDASDDLGSREKGGDLGWVSRGVMVPEFEEALFSQEVNKVGEPVLSSFGWHLILVDEIQAQAVQAFEDEAVQATLLEQYRAREKAERFEQLAKQLDELSFDHPDSLEPVAEALGMKVQETDWITRGGEATGIASQAAVIDAAFSSTVLDNKENSAPIKLGADRVLVVRAAEYEAAEQRPLEAVEAEIRQALKDEQARKAAKEAAMSALAKLQDGAEPRAVAAEFGLSLKSPGWIGRDDNSVDPALLQRTFRLPRPEGDARQYDVVMLADGEAVIALQAVRDGDPAAATQAEREAVQRNLIAKQSQAEFSAYLDAAKRDIKVEIHEDQL